MLPGRRTPEGAIFVIQGPPPAGTPLVGGIAVSPAGVIYANGVGSGTPPTHTYSANGYMVDELGTLQFNPPPINHFIGGLPSAVGGQLVGQLNQPESPGDAFVGGIRVGPLGGIYVVDLTPPPELDSFSDGFSGGFQ
jgi:hypothetical protein